MIQWFDILLAVLVSYGMLFSFLNIPMIGFIIAYGFWQFWNLYCLWRKTNL